MDDLTPAVNFRSAKETLDDDTSILSSDGNTETLKNPHESQASFQKNNMMLSEERTKDKAARSIGGTHPAFFRHSGIPAVCNSDHILPKGGVVNGPVSHTPLTKMSVMNKGGVALSVAQTLGHRTADSKIPNSKLGCDLQILTKGIDKSAQQVLYLLPNIPTQNSVNCAKKITTSVPVTGCEASTFKITSIKTEDCEESISQMQENHGRSSVTDNYRTETVNDLNWDPEKEFMQFLMTDEDEVNESRLHSNVSFERQKRILDDGSVEDYTDDFYFDDSVSPRNSSIYNANVSENIEEKPFMFYQKYSLKKHGSDCEVLDSTDSLSKESFDAVNFSFPNGRGDKGMSPARSSSTLSSSTFRTNHPMPKKSSDLEPSFFPCTKCNVNFKEKKHLHRHMMNHLDGNSNFRHMNVPRPYACKECGRTFRDRNSLLKHMIIHQERRQRLMEEIRELKELQDEGRSARLQCPQCIFGTNCPKTFVQHAKTHEKDKKYYCCEECNFMAVSENELECHRNIAHGAVVKKSSEALTIKTEKNSYISDSLIEPSKNPSTYMCRLCPFTTYARSILKKHMVYLHQIACRDQFTTHPVPEHKSEISDHPNLDRPKQLFNMQQFHTFPKHSILKKDIKRPFGPTGLSYNFKELYKKNPKIQKARKSMPQAPATAVGSQNSPSFKNAVLKRGVDPRHVLYQHAQRERSDIRTNRTPFYRTKYENFNKIRYFPNKIFPLNIKKEDVSYTGPVSTTKPGGAYSNFRPAAAFSVREKLLKQKRDGISKTAKDFMRKLNCDRQNSTEKFDQFSDDIHSVKRIVLPKSESFLKSKSFDSRAVDKFNEHSLQYSLSAVQDGVEYEDDQNTVNAHQRGRNAHSDHVDSKKERESHNSRLYFDYYDDAEKNDKHSQDEQNAEYLEHFGLKLPYSSDFNWDELPLEKKTCPYCPAMFETGVGLSNHVRGHLHRAGFTYEARHVVSPEQIASTDKVQHIKKTGTPVKRARKALVKSENPFEHSCILCGGWFDTKIGLSNHVRGHLKRLGKTKWDSNKSPICVLEEMLQNEEKFAKIAKVLNNRRIFPKPKFAKSDRLSFSSNGIPREVQNRDAETEPVTVDNGDQDDYVKINSELHDEKSSQSSSLIELLKKKKLDEDLDDGVPLTKNTAQTARKRVIQKYALPLSEDNNVLVYQPQKLIDSTLQTGMPVKLRKCAYCKATFTSAVSLSNHLRAYERRKQAGLLTGTAADCKQVKPRSRPGSKKKVSPLPHSVEDVYILKCRFCGLVFRGPLSVQEDWIKHLQRHVVNAALPRTGAGMVEVEALPAKLTETPFPLLTTDIISQDIQNS
ncbi:zinc finger protein 644 [Protopterus annectens]|uniref:zinc finger protein 644 n=1 Tax=Protopterus annectens TaxID=7888 RepID=UPI001CF9E676|nr:zinc finger protein 644 [Protopterus annectens]XP_043941591.1 zinc finger protein 644 [Protopterus annectens]